jgi:hypothetical protein
MWEFSVRDRFVEKCAQRFPSIFSNSTQGLASHLFLLLSQTLKNLEPT